MARPLADLTAPNLGKTASSKPAAKKAVQPKFKDPADQQKYLASITNSGIDPRVDPKNPQAYEPQGGSVQFRKSIASIRDGLAAGKLTVDAAHSALNNAVMQEAALYAPGSGNFLNRLLSDFGNIAEYTPAAILQAGKAGVLDAADTLSGHPTVKRLNTTVAQPTVESVKRLVNDPVGFASNNPVSFALTVSPLATAPFSVAARLGSAAGAAAAADGAGATALALAKALAKQPIPKDRVLAVPLEDGTTRSVVTAGSINPLANLIQRKVIDAHRQKVLNNGPTQPVLPGGATVGKLVGTESHVGSAIRRERHVNDVMQQAVAAPLAKYGQTTVAKAIGSKDGAVLRPNKRLSAAEQKAIDIEFSGVPVDVHIAAAQNGFNEAKAALASAEQNLAAVRSAGGNVKDAKKSVSRAAKTVIDQQTQLALSIAAKTHLSDPRPLLRQAIQDSYSVSKAGEQIKMGAGLSADTAAQRIGARADVIESQATGAPSLVAQMNGLQKQIESGGDASVIQPQIDAISQQLVAKGNDLIQRGAAYVPQTAYAKARQAPAAGRRVTPRGITTAMRGSAYVNKRFTGALQRSGGFRTDTTNLIRDDYLHAQKWASLKAAVDEAAQLPAIDPHSPYALFIRDMQQITPEIRQLFDSAERGGVNKADRKALSPQLVNALDQLVPDARKIDKNNLPPGIKAVDGRLAKAATAVAQSGKFQGSFGKGADTLNNAFRAALLYTTPKYALNLGQALGTNVARQGVFAPVNWAKAMTLSSRMSVEDAAKVMGLMGEGLSKALDTQTGKGTQAINAIADKWAMVTDTIPRVAAFIHEARVYGYRTPVELHKLLNDPSHRARLGVIVERANKESVEFGNLTPFEQNAVKRAIFFYPWVRAAAKYTGRFPVEHPYQAGVLAAMAPDQQQNLYDALGGKPPHYLEGSIPMFGNIANPQAVGTFSTTTDIANALAGVTMPNSQSRYDLMGNLSPVAQVVIGALTGKTGLGTEYPRDKSPIVAALRTLGESTPPVAAFERALRGTPSVSSTAKQPIKKTGGKAAALQYALGGAAPIYNLAAVVAKGDAEYAQSLPKDKRVDYRAAKTLAAAQTAAQALYKQGRLPSPDVPEYVSDALDLQQQYDRAVVSAKTMQDRWKARLDVLERNGKISAEYRQAVERDLAKIPQEKAQTLINKVWRSRGGGAELTHWRHITKKQK